MGRNGAGRARPLLGRGGVVGQGHSRVKRSGPGWCNPPVGKPAGPETSGPPSESPEGPGTPWGWGRAGTPGAGWCAPLRPLVPAPSPRGTCSRGSPALRPSRFPPSQPPFPRRVILGTQSLRGPRRNFFLGWEGVGTQASGPLGPLLGSREGRWGCGGPQGPALGEERGRGVEHSSGGGGGARCGPEASAGSLSLGNALPGHLLREGPRGPGSAFPKAALLPSPGSDPAPHCTAER